MIERKFIENKVKEYKIKSYLKEKFVNAGYSSAEIEKTPLGLKIKINTSKPGIIVGKGGKNIAEMTRLLKKKFKLESPQLEVNEVREPELDANIMAERIVYQIKRFGKTRFKAIGYNTLRRIMKAGAVGAEVVISGRIPGKRHKTWRFKEGRLPKNGHVANNLVDKGFKDIQWKQGSVGVKVNILSPYVKTPDQFNIIKTPEKVQSEEVSAHGDTKEEGNKRVKQKRIKKEE